jgi:hypothetical protein
LQSKGIAINAVLPQCYANVKLLSELKGVWNQDIKAGIQVLFNKDAAPKFGKNVKLAVVNIKITYR